MPPRIWVLPLYVLFVLLSQRLPGPVLINELVPEIEPEMVRPALPLPSASTVSEPAQGERHGDGVQPGIDRDGSPFCSGSSRPVVPVVVWSV